VNVAEEAAVNSGGDMEKPARRSGEDLGAKKGYGERKATGSEKAAEDLGKKRQGDTSKLTDEQKKRYGIK
jgi:hypothetical protein